MTKSEARQARKRGALQDWKPAPKPVVCRKRSQRWRETAAERCARFTYEYDRDC